MNDPYFNSILTVERLVKEFKEHNGLIIGFDFDDTVFDFHGKGYKYPKLITLLQEAHSMGCTLVCHTGNPNENQVFNTIKEMGIIYLRESPIMFGKKPYFNILLDDRAGLHSAYLILKETLNIVKET